MALDLYTKFTTKRAEKKSSSKNAVQMDQDPILARKSIILYVVNLGTSRYSKKPGYLVTPPIARCDYFTLEVVKTS